MSTTSKQKQKEEAFKALTAEVKSKYGGTTEEKSSSVSTSKNTSVTTVDRKAKSQEKFSTLHKEAQAKYNPKSQVTTSYISSFMEDADNFISSFQKAYDGMHYLTASSAYDSRKNTANNLSERSRAISQYLDDNKEYYDTEVYDSFKKYLQDFGKASSQALSSLAQKKDYFSQWETYEDYQEYEQQQKEYEEKKNFDITAGEKEISSLEAMLQEYKNLTRFTTDENGVRRAYEIRQKYGDEKAIKALISQKKQYLNQAKHIQKGETLAGVAERGSDNYDIYFNTHSKYKSTIKENPSWWETGVGDTQYEWINNQNGFRDEYESSMADLDAKIEMYGQSRGSDESWYYQKGYDQMTSNEVAIYNYYYAKEGKEKAQEYLDSIQESLNYRKATAMFEDLDDNTFQEMVFGIEAGFDQFESGISSLLSDKDYIPQSAVQMASGMVREDLADRGAKLPDWMGGGSLGQMGYDAITTSANMAPSIITSTVIGMINPVAGQAVGGLMMGASAAGNAYQEMLNLGYDKDQAKTYAALVGGSEAGLQYLLGGIGKLGGKVTGGAIEKMLNGVDNAFARFAVKFAGSMISEGFEEGVQEILTPMFQNLVMHTDEKVNWGEVAYSTLLGALTAGVMEGPSTIASEVGTYNTGRQLQDAGVTAQQLSDIGNKFSMDTVAYQLAGRVDENTGAYTMGRLFNEIGATMTEQNVNDITEALAKTMPRDMARANAKAMAAVVEGGNLTDIQIKAIEGNDVLATAVRTTIIDPNATWFQRTNGYNEALKALAQETASPNASRTNPAQQSEDNAPASDKVDAQNKNGTEADSEAEVAEPKARKISSIKDGKVTIELEDGSEVNVKEAGIDPDEGVRIETIASIEGISSEDANFILGTLRTNTGASAQFSALGAKEAYKYGYFGFSQEHMMKHGAFAASLTETQRNAIYEKGRNARQQQVDNRNATVDNRNATVDNRNATIDNRNATGAKQTGIYFDAGGGNVMEFDSAKKTLTEKQTAGVRAAQVLRKLGIGGDIYFFESYRNSKNQLVYKDKNGKEIKAPNGWYSEKDGSIHIDLNSGRGGNGFVLFTLAHELTHFIEQWSPQKYKALAEFLTENYEKGHSMDKLVRAKQEKLSELRGKSVSYKEAYSEVVADSMEAMLADGNVLDKLVELKAKDNDLLSKMKQFFDNLVAKIRRIYNGQVPDSAEGRAVLEMKDSIEKIQQLFAEALAEASENFQSAVESVVEENAQSVDENEIITDGAVVTDGQGIKYSIRSMKHDIAEGQMFEDLKKYCGWSQRKVNELKKNLKDLVEYMTPYREILDMNETYDRDGRRFSPYKPNSDPLYKISMDFSTLCSKRLLTQYVIENLQLRENRPMSAEEQMAIRDMLNEYRQVEKGLQVACAMCYVEAARLKSPKQITKWMEDPATQMKNYFADKDPEFAQYIKDKQADFKESRGYARNATKKDMSPKDVKELNKIRPRLRSQYKLSAEETKIVERAVSLPGSTYLTAGNLAALSESDPTIYAAYTAFVRTATRSKSLETDEPYYYGDSTRDNGNGIVVSDSFIEAVNRENGMRFSSWSDWRIQHLLDYITAVIDNSVRGAAMHGYTKFGDEVRVLGKTGMMFNMSGVAGTQTGLNEDGSLSFSSTESIDVNEAIQLRDEFPETAGLQCIGVGDDHIVALLRSDIIDYVIPYHVSGLNAGLRRMANIFGWKDYTSTQHAAIDKSVKLENAVDKEHWHEEPVYSEFFVGYDTGMTGIEAMRASADRYVQLCKDRGLKPKFEQFVNEDNYWKLLIDRKMVNQKTGELIRQKPVTPTFDFDTIKSVVDKYVQNYDSGMEVRALNHIVENWDSIPKRIRDLKKQGGTKAKKTSKAVDTLANQTLAAQPVGENINPSQEDGKHYSDRPYSYDTLTSKHDMTVTVIDGNVPKNRADVIAQAKKNAAKVGKFNPKDGSVSVHVNDINRDVVLGTAGLKHSLDRRMDVNASITLMAGEILQNSIQINELTPQKAEADESYVLIGAAINSDCELFVVRSVVNRFSNELASMDVLYAINAKKENRLRSMRPGFQGPVTDSTISIADLLAYVNQHFPDVLPEDVLKHFGHDSRPEGKLGESALYSDRDTESVSNRSLLANAFEGVAQNDIERNKIQEYKGKIALIESEERKFSELNERIKELSFTKGPKDTKAIRDLQFEAKQTANRINTYDRQLLRLEASKPLQDVLEREKQKAYKRAEKKGKEALEAYREKAAKTQKELLNKYQDAKKKAAENREKTAMRNKIQNVVKELNDLLLNESKKRHVPDSLKKAVADALALVNMDTVGAEERAAKYAALIAKETDLDKIDAYTATMENILRQGDKIGQRLKELRDAYEEIQESDDPDIANAYDPVIAGCLKELSGSIGNTSLRNMTIEQLSDVYDMYRMVLTRVRDANKTLLENIKENISSLASRVIGEVRMTGGDHKYRAAILDPVRKFLWNNLKPVYAMEHIGSSTLTRVFNNVRAGEDTWAKDVTEAREYYLDKAKKYGYNSWDFKKKYRFDSASELEFELTLEQILSLYAYSKREQAHEHLRLGGFVFDSNIETYNDKDSKIIKYKVNTADAHQITPEILANIISKLSQEQMSFVDEMQDYLSTVMGAKGNEVTMKMYGVKLFKEKFYFPLKSAKQFMFEQNEVSGEVKIKNSGFTNKVVAKANNPVILSNFMDVWSGHVNDMSMYHSFVLPLEDFNRVFNYNSPKKENQPPVSVKGTIQNAYSPAAVGYVKNLITDLNGGARTDPATGTLNWLMGRFKKGAVFASASVVVQQPSAIARAAAIIDTKYFIGPKVDHKRHKALWDEVKQYAPVAVIKEMGYFDTNMGKSTQDFILGKEYSGISEKAKALVTDSGYRDEVLSKAPALADEIAWCSIWEAAKRETKAKHPGMDVKSEAFLKLAGERFTEVIVKTQVYDSVLSRSANMRSKDTGMKMVTAFMAEPTTSINMIADALLKAKRGDKKTCRKAIGSVVASVILNSFLVAWVYAARDDDDEKTYTEKYLASFVSGIVDGVNPATYIPFIKDAVSIVQGYDVERSDMAVISDLWNASQQLGKDDVSAWRKVEGFVGSICQIFGLPVKNIMRDVRSVFQAYDTIVNGENTTKAGIKYAVKESVTGKSTPNKEQLYEARLAGDEEHKVRVEARYGDTDSADAAVLAAIKDRFMEDEIDEATALKQMVLHSGKDASEAHWTMDAWKYRKAKGSDDGYNKYGRLYDAVRTGKNLKAVVKEYTDYGVKPTTMTTQITERFKPDYLKMSASERASLKGYLANAYEMCGMKREDALEKIEKWDFEAEHGFAYAERKEAYATGMVSENDLVQILMERGYTQEDAEAQVEGYEWEAEGIEGATVDAIQDYTEWCEPVGIPKATYMAFRKFANSTKNDVDENGKTVNYSAVQKIMAYINNLNLTSAQKDALAKSKGWSDKTISKYKLW